MDRKKRQIQTLEKEKKDLKYKIEDLLAESVSLYNSDDDNVKSDDDSEKILKNHKPEGISKKGSESSFFGDSELF